MIARLEHSRAVLLGSRYTGAPEDELSRALDASVTVVTVQRDCESAVQTTTSLLGLLRRMPGTVVLVGETLPGGVAEELAHSVARIAPDRGVVIAKAMPEHATARIHVGAHGHPRDAVRVVPEGYGAHLLADPDEDGPTVRPPNSLGCMLAAAFGACESFTVNAQVIPRRRRSATRISFCPVTLTSDLHAAPDLTDTLLDLALLGCGAVGTAMAVILDGLPLLGRLLAADRELYGRENVGTYSLGTFDDADAGSRKVDLVAARLRRFEVIVAHGELAELPRSASAGRIPWPQLALSGLDSVEARWAAQRLWPDRLFDAATGDTTVGVHDTYPTGPCIECVFPPKVDGPSALELLAELTGLDISVLGRDEPLARSDLAGVPEEKRSRLLQLIGTPKCALAKAYGLTDLDADSYRPSVAFVSAQAACLGVGALVAHLTGVTRPTLFQYDALVGPHRATAEDLRPRAECYCQQHRGRIEALRSRRPAPRTPS